MFMLKKGVTVSSSVLRMEELAFLAKNQNNRKLLSKI